MEKSKTVYILKEDQYWRVEEADSFINFPSTEWCLLRDATSKIISRFRTAFLNVHGRRAFARLVWSKKKAVAEKLYATFHEQSISEEVLRDFIERTLEEEVFAVFSAKILNL
jgi:hypothetical protein